MGKFVGLSKDGLQLELDGNPYKFVGANCYYLQTHAVVPGRKERATALLSKAAEAGITVIRTWAHSEGPHGDHIQQGVTKHWNPDGSVRYAAIINERALVGLDYIVSEAARLKLRLILSLTNHWDDYGGMGKYADWVGEPKKGFYTSSACQRLFRDYVKLLLGRTNTITRVRYSDDPTILAWSLANEPRGFEGTAEGTLSSWIKSTAKYVKSLDPNHLVTVDLEGFFKYDTPGYDVDYLNPKNGNDGCDFLTDAAQPGIDFACVHIYADDWLKDSKKPPKDFAYKMKWTLDWLDAHVSACKNTLHKPLVVNEFSLRLDWNIHGDPWRPRRDYLTEVYAWLLENMKPDGIVSGSCVWMIADAQYQKESDDGFQIALDGSGRDGAQQIRDHAAAFSHLPASSHQPASVASS